MQKIIAILVASAALASPIAAQKPSEPVTTIIIDTRDVCYMGKLADAERDKANRKARQLKRDLEAQGKTVRIVKVDGTIRMASFGNGPNVHVPGC